MREEPIEVTITEEMNALRASLNRMANQVETRVQATLDAWLNHQSDLADSVRHADDEIDQLELDLEAQCMEIMVRQQPVARDMRFLIASLRIIHALERMADLARSISKRVMKLERGESVVPPPVAQPMAQTVRGMTRDLIVALRDLDVETAAKIRLTDRAVDRYNKDVFRWAAERVGADPDGAEDYLNTLILCRNLERIGDLAANAAEDIIFAVEGDVVRHTPPEPSPT